MTMGRYESDAGLEARIVELEKAAAKLKSSQGGGSTARWLLLLTVLAVFGTISWFLYAQYVRMRSAEFSNKVMEAFYAKRQNYEPTLRREGEALYKDLSPKLMKIVNEQVQADTPKLTAALNVQGEELRKSLPEAVKKRMQEEIDGLMAELVAEVRAEIPGADEASLQAFAANMKAALTKKMKADVVDPVAQQAERLHATWEKFPPADAPKPGEESVGTQMMGHLWEVLAGTINTTRRPVRAAD